MQLEYLTPLYDRSGPWASAYLDASYETEDAAQLMKLRWQAAREALDEQGADAGTLDAMGEAVLGSAPPAGPGGLAIFAAGGTVALTTPLPTAPAQPITWYGPLPHAMPLVTLRGEQIPWLRVVVDRTGADVEACSGGLLNRREVSGGHTYPLHKSGQGGWSQSRYERATVLTWDRNTRTVAEAVDELAGKIGAEVIIVAGDPQARSLLVGNLPTRWQHRVVTTDAGSRAPGADPEPLDEATALAVGELVHERIQEVVDRYHSQLGNEGAAGTGVPAIVTALQRAQVDTLLVASGTEFERELWIGPEPLELAEDAADLRAAGVEEPQRVRADAALIRALVATDAEVVLVMPDEAKLEGGLGALFRYSDQATRRH